MYSFKQRHAVWQKKTLKGFLLPFFILGVLFGSIITLGGREKAQAVTSSTLNFQGRLLTNTGARVPDGSYNIEFKLYTAANIDGGESLVQGSCQTTPGPIADEDCAWVETRTGGNTVTVQNGYFSVNLGSVNPFPSTINWDQELWLGMNIGGIGTPSWDGEMTPRFKLTAVPYAFRAGAVMNAAGTSAFDADDLAQLSPSSVQTINAAVAALRLNQTGTGALLQLQGDGTDVFTVDKSGNAVLGAGITLGNSSSSVAGTIRWNGSTFQGYNGSTWASLGSSAVMPFVSLTKTADETENNITNPTATLQPDNELTFAIGANETWNYRFHLQMTVNAAPDVKFSISAPTGATCVNSVTDEENAISVANLGCGVSSGIIAVATGVDAFIVSGSVTNGTTAGNVTLNWAQNTANAANTIVRAGSFVEASRSVGGSSADVAFIQNGNSFGGTAVLGTNDANGLSFETNGVERMQILSTGEIRSSDDLIANRTTTGVTGTTSGTGTTTTTLTLASDVFSVNDVVLIDNAGQDYYTRITADAGTGSYTVSPAITFENARTVTAYTVQNIGATTTDYSSQANRFFQGYFLGGVVIGAGSTTLSDGNIESTTTLRIQQGGGDVEVGGGLTVVGAITGDGSGLTNIDGSAVDGSTITTLNASNISSGTIADARLSTNVTLAGNSFNGVSQLVQLDGSGALPAISGANLTSLNSANLTGALPAISGASLTSLNGSNISSGTVADARLSTNVTLLGNTFNGINQLVQLDGSGILPALNGSALTNLSSANLTGALPAISGANLTSLTAANLTGALPAISGASLTSLNASNISSGTIDDARLSTNVTVAGNTFNGANQLLQLNASGQLPAISGINLTSIPSANLSGALPAISGASLTSLNGSNISSGTIDDARLSTNVTLMANTFNGVNQLVQLNGSGALPALSGANLTSLTSANLTGALPAISGASLTSLSAGNLTGALPAISGASLTSLNGSNISSGTVADTYLSTNVALLSGSQTFSGTKTFSTGLVLGQSTITSAATVARAVSLPDEAGTICLSNTNTCGYLRLAAGSLQTDASNNDVLAVNKTSATGNLILLQRSGTAVFTVANTGALQIQATSSTALDIRNASGTSYFLVDANTGSVTVGAGTAAANGVLFILDTRTADPTGVAGGSYYNSTDGKMRCYEGTIWTDCNTTNLLGETTLGVAGTTITVNLAASTEYLQCRLDAKGRTLASVVNVRFNGDAGGTSYGWNTYGIATTVVIDAQDSSDSELQLNGTTTGNVPFSADLRISNFADTRKAVEWTAIGAEPIGTDMNRYSGGGTWNNTAAQISSVSFITSAGNFTAGSHAWCEGRNVR